MTDSNNGSYFLIENGRLYKNLANKSRNEVTHVRRLDGGGEDYLALWVVGDTVLAGYAVGDVMFTLKVSPDGRLQGMVPGGYQYDFVANERGNHNDK
jgi:hypothetical protein